VFAAATAVAARGVSAYPAEVTGQMVKNFLAGACGHQSSSPKPIDADPAHLRTGPRPSDGATSTQGPAMTSARGHAMAYGMMAAEARIDVLCLGEMGIANTRTAATLCAALFGGAAPTGRGPAPA